MEDAIFTRVSIRKFTDEGVTEEDVERLMRAAMAAPSAGNQQPWEFFVTRDIELKQKLSETSPYARPAGGAAVVIVPCLKQAEMRFPEYGAIDLSACTENILLEAAAMGLGAVWLGVYPEQDRVDAVAQCLGNPEGVVPFALVALGHPAEEVPPRSAKRFDPERIHWV